MMSNRILLVEDDGAMSPSGFVVALQVHSLALVVG